MRSPILYDKRGLVVFPSKIVSFLSYVTRLRTDGFRKGFAIKLACQTSSLSLETGKEIWKRRYTWLRKGR